MIREKGLDRSIVTLEFVLELQELVQVKGKMQIRKPLASEKITVRQYCHILATLGDKEKFMFEESVPDKIVKVFWNHRDQQTIKEKLAKGKIGLQDAWSPLIKHIAAPSSTTSEYSASTVLLFIFMIMHSW